MKKSLSLVLALGLVCLLAISAGATTKKAAAAAAKKAAGAVVSVDATASTVVVKEKTADITLTVNDKTAITCGKDKKVLADIKAGDAVKAAYIVEGTTNMATKIEIAAAPAVAAPAKKAAVKK